MARQGSQRELLALAHTQCPWLSMGPSLHTCLETYDVLVFIHTRLSSLQQPPHRNTLTQGGLKKVLVLLPSSLATSTHVSRGLHCVRCHSSSITAQGKFMEVCRGLTSARPVWASGTLTTDTSTVMGLFHSLVGHLCLFLTTDCIQEHPYLTTTSPQSVSFFMMELNALPFLGGRVM